MENQQRTRLDVLAEFTGIEKEKFSTNSSYHINKLPEYWSDFTLESDGDDLLNDTFYNVLATEDEIEERLSSLLHDTTKPSELIERFGSEDEDDMDISDESLEDYLNYEGELHGYKIYSC